MIYDYYRRTQCGFFWYRLDYSASGITHDEMLTEIQRSGLTHIVLHMEDSCCFWVVNNRFAPDDFRRLMVNWCGRFDQEKVFVTWARRDSPDTVDGFMFNSCGSEELKYDTRQVEQMVNELVDSARSVEVHETSWPNNYSVAGRVIGIHTFKRMYPHLVLK